MRPRTLAEAVNRIDAGEAYDVVLAEFVDSFLMDRDAAARYASIAIEPPRVKDAKLNALVGAISEYLAKQYRLPRVPPWTSESWRYLDEPWFTTSSESAAMREYLSFVSPAEFRSRNIFTEERPLRRARSHLPYAETASTAAE